MSTKICTKCSETKAVSEFPLNGQGKTRPDCKKCHTARNSRGYYQKRPEAIQRKHKRISLPKGCNSLAVADSLGRTYGKLTVVRFSGYAKNNQSNSRSPLVECLCSCGSTVVVRLWDLKSQKTESCGSHPRFDDRSLPAFRNIYNHSYRNRALKNGLEFNLSEERFRRLTQMDCHYCGSPPLNKSYRAVNGKRGQFKSGSTHSQYIYNGLDRVDSSKGYTLDNVVPCCGICNHAKHTMSYEQFTAWLDRVTAFRGGN